LATHADAALDPAGEAEFSDEQAVQLAASLVVEYLPAAQ
jgi:hypothetical protein